MNEEKPKMAKMWVRQEQLEAVRALKKHTRQPDYEVLDMLLEAYDIVHAQATMQPPKGVRADG